jgi:hypothetical protein
LLDAPGTIVNARLPTLVAALSIVGFLGWLAYSAPANERASAGVAAEPAVTPEPAVVFQERSMGSEVPCAVPLAWRVARVDPEFAMSEEQAAATIQEAAALWESATNRELFRRDPDDGFPIRLVYDERQGRATERTQRQRALDTMRVAIEARREEITTHRERYQASVADHRDRARELDRRINRHNAAVEELNAAADPPEPRRRELEAAGAVLRRETEALEAERAALDEQQASLRADETRLDERMRDHQRLSEQLATVLPNEEVEAGVYREAVSRRGGEVVEVGREIRLYRFTDADELRLLAAHEMGHALGLGHLDDPAAVMSARARGDALPSGLSSSDVELFRRTCPGGVTSR